MFRNSIFQNIHRNHSKLTDECSIYQDVLNLNSVQPPENRTIHDIQPARHIETKSYRTQTEHPTEHQTEHPTEHPTDLTD